MPPHTQRTDEQDFIVTRSVTLPDKLRITRYGAAPQFGPKILFFSGGTALNPLARRLTTYTHNSIHLTTPFDSGGSSGKLRQALSVPAVGDLRSRLMALADRTVRGQGPILDLFGHRFSQEAKPQALYRRFVAIAQGRDPLMDPITRPMRDLIARHLQYFADVMLADFDLRGASIGNLVLVGGYLHNDRNLETVLFLFSRLAEVRGIVHPIVDLQAHLAATLQDGTPVLGQHAMTGKETPPIQSPIENLELVENLDGGAATPASIDETVTEFIRGADLICYPMGSFYSSVIANFLPSGVGSAIASNVCPKVYVPNTGQDPEQLGMTLSQCARQIAHYLSRSISSQPDQPVSRSTSVSDFLHFILIDPDPSTYAIPLDLDEVRALGVQTIRTPLVSPSSAPDIDPDLLCSALLSLA